MENSIYFVGFIIFIVYLVEVVRYKRLKKEVKAAEEKIIQSKYPELSVVDRKYRQACISDYIRFYFKENSRRLKLLVIALFAMILLMGIILGFLFSGNLIGACLSLTLFLFLESLYLFYQPNIEKLRNFYEDYLNEHPNNPLMIVISPFEKKRIAC